MDSKSYFTKQLLEWYHPDDRPLPWKGIDNPYFIWLSEIILQQTRVEQGLPYYIAFTEKYPTVVDLAQAPEDEVLKLWQGLGYYSRARNLHHAAQTIVESHNGQFPESYKEILALKGIGQYTAAAIASFAFGLPYAVVDGNVYRVLARYFGIDTPTDTTKGKKLFQQLANTLLFKKNPGGYNQAIMDFGATICTPKDAACVNCVMQKKCKAVENKNVYAFPVKSKRIVHKKRWFYYIIIHVGDKVVLRKRTAQDIWQNLYDFPLIETPISLPEEEMLLMLKQTEKWRQWFAKQDIEIKSVSKEYKQTLSHQKISTFFIEVFYKGDVKGLMEQQNDKFILTNRKKMQTFAFPKMVAEYLLEK